MEYRRRIIKRQASWTRPAAVMAYGATESDAVAATKALALRVPGERMEHREVVGNLTRLEFIQAA